MIRSLCRGGPCVSPEYRKSIDITMAEVIDILNLYPNSILLDVRSEQEFREGHLLGAINIPLYELYCNAKNILVDKNEIIIVYCQVGLRSKKAIEILKNLGYKNLYNIKNGIE